MDLVTFIQAQPVASVIGSTIGGITVYWLTHRITDSNLKNQLEKAERRYHAAKSELKQSKDEVLRLLSFETQYNNVKRALPLVWGK